MAMQSKNNLILANKTWDLTPLPKGKQDLPCKWVYKIKITSHDGQQKCKAWLVAKGFKQEQGINFDEVFSLVVKMTTWWCVAALVAKHDLVLHQMDVRTTFLHGDLHEEVYMQQLEGFVEKGKNNWYAN